MDDLNVVIEINNVAKKYGDRKVLDGVSYGLQAGKVYGLMGENGAGKSTLLKILMGLVKPEAGEVICDRNLRWGALIEDVGAYGKLNAQENLKIFAEYIHSYNRQKILELLNTVGLSDVGKKKVKNYSVGMKKRLGLAIALLSNPDVLVLDEPTTGLDIDGIIGIRNIIKDFMKQEERLVIISSHDTRDLVEVCDTIIFLHKGKLVLLEEGFNRDSLKLEQLYMELVKG